MQIEHEFYLVETRVGIANKIVHRGGKSFSNFSRRDFKQKDTS
jgi:hypothetical protein